MSTKAVITVKRRILYREKKIKFILFSMVEDLYAEDGGPLNDLGPLLGYMVLTPEITRSHSRVIQNVSKSTQ